MNSLMHKTRRIRSMCSYHVCKRLYLLTARMNVKLLNLFRDTCSLKWASYDEGLSAANICNISCGSIGVQKNCELSKNSAKFKIMDYSFNSFMYSLMRCSYHRQKFIISSMQDKSIRRKNHRKIGIIITDIIDSSA